MRGFLVGAILIAFVMVFFSVQNAQTVRVSFLSWHQESPLAVILLASFAAGAVTALCASLPSQIRNRREIRTLKRQISLSSPPTTPETHNETAPPAR